MFACRESAGSGYMERISSDTRKKVQYVITDMLRQFDKICRDNDIEYFVCYGTELGAVRHQGFIPWDDDADVGMMREDYEKFRKVFESQDTGNLYLASPDGDYEWHEKVYPRLYYLGTEMELGYWNDCFELSGDKFGKAINLDIFLFDYVDNDPAKIEDTIKKALKLKRRYMYYKFKSKIVKNRGARAFVMSLMKRLMYDFHHNDPDASRKQYEKYKQLVQHPKSDYIINFDDLEAVDIRASLLRYDQVFPTVPGMFEGFEVRMQRDYDAALTKLYGDYMTPPEGDAKDVHKTVRASFGDYKFPDSFED